MLQVLTLKKKEGIYREKNCSMTIKTPSQEVK